MSAPAFTLGIEEEYMVVNPETRELSSHDQKIVEHAGRILDDQVKAEYEAMITKLGLKTPAPEHGQD